MVGGQKFWATKTFKGGKKVFLKIWKSPQKLGGFLQILFVPFKVLEQQKRKKKPTLGA